MILFLDFDGVMHPRAAAGKYFTNLPRLEAVLRDFEFLNIVISSSWRETLGLEDIKSNFSEDLQNRIIGVTPIHDVDPFAEILGSRLGEVLSYLEQAGKQHASWLALDNEAPLYHPDCPNLIICNPLTGLAASTSWWACPGPILMRNTR